MCHGCVERAGQACQRRNQGGVQAGWRRSRTFEAGSVISIADEERKNLADGGLGSEEKKPFGGRFVCVVRLGSSDFA